MAFRLALTVGKIVTSRAPLTPSGLGPKIKKATAAEITTDTIYIMLIQKLSLLIMRPALAIHQYLS